MGRPHAVGHCRRSRLIDQRLDLNAGHPCGQLRPVARQSATVRRDGDDRLIECDTLTRARTLQMSENQGGDLLDNELHTVNVRSLLGSKQTLDGRKASGPLLGRPPEDRPVVIATAEDSRKHSVEPKSCPLRGRLVDRQHRERACGELGYNRVGSAKVNTDAGH